MTRLAEYLTRLAIIFGSQEYVYFLQVRKGSAVLETHVQTPAALAVSHRLHLVASEDVPKDATKSIQAINMMLREDNASAVLSVKRGAQIIKFPGCKTPLAEEAIVIEAGELLGSVIKVGGKDKTVPLLLQDTDGETFSCTTTREIARGLARHLFGDVVRVQGTGKWRRTSERIWMLDDFQIKSWEAIGQTLLADEVTALRAVEGSSWNEFSDPQAELKKLREA